MTGGSMRWGPGAALALLVAAAAIGCGGGSDQASEDVGTETVG
jgi:hypothetical protein